MTSPIPNNEPGGRHVSIGDTRLYIVERGQGYPLLVLAGRADRTCAVEGAETMARSLPHAELVIFEQSGHMTFVEENERYLTVVRDFLQPGARV